MPIYEYLCTKCGERFEVFSKTTQQRNMVCKKCNGTAERVISKTSFILKGGGWYKDGYTKSSANKSKEATIKESGKGKKESEKKGR